MGAADLLSMENPPLPPSDNAAENKRREQDARSKTREHARALRKLIFPPDEPKAAADD